MTSVVVVDRAAQQLREIDAWWREHRLDAETLVVDEFQALCDIAGEHAKPGSALPNDVGARRTTYRDEEDEALRLLRPRFPRSIESRCHGGSFALTERSSHVQFVPGFQTISRMRLSDVSNSTEL